ncbi:hypothetical protein PIB30_073489 [Stylosanthes scabra]|uniref:Putative plant transposon protein domain-containing protein n=1 Tax=Stylosanthes scabra TaxID=79078 RepID=A0ABU6QPY3_9FABA|nr:hypothetical protein [Stylosanthes scabra]
MRFKRETTGAETDYNTRKAIDQRLDEKDRIAAISKGLARIHYSSLVPTGNKSEVTTTRAILIHSIMQGEDVRAEDIIADSMATTAQGLTSKGNLAHPSTIYKLCKDAGVPLREFTRTPRIPELSYITPRYESQYHEDLQGIKETLSSMQFFQQTFYEKMQKSQADYMEEVKQLKEKQEQIYNHNQRFHS